MIGSLFSGIGGLELGLESVGLGPVVWQVEMDPYARAVLAKHWPSADRTITDVRKASSANLAPVDIICGGFPCTDISFAGKGAGLAGEHSGLWFEFRRVVCELRPRIVVVENVAALRSRGLGTVLGDLATLGYDARWESIRASDVGAPHRRERLFIVAHAERRACNRRQLGAVDRRGQESGDEPRRCGEGPLADAASERGRSEARACDGPRAERAGRPEPEGACAAMADAEQIGRARSPHARTDPGDPGAVGRGLLTTAGVRSGEPEPGLGRNPDGLSTRLDEHRWPVPPGEAQHEGEPPRTASKVPNRGARLRALGNAVVPQVAAQVGRIVIEILRANA